MRLTFQRSYSIDSDPTSYLTMELEGDGEILQGA